MHAVEHIVKKSNLRMSWQKLFLLQRKTYETEVLLLQHVKSKGFRLFSHLIKCLLIRCDDVILFRWKFFVETAGKLSTKN